MGATPRPKKHFTSRAESAAVAALDVRCACQFFQSESLLPERVNPVGSRPSSSQGYYSRPISPDLAHHVFEPDYVDPESQRKFSFGVVGSIDHYSFPTLSDVVADGDKSALNNGQQNFLSSSVDHDVSNKTMDTLRQKDPSQSVLLRRRSESTQKNLENSGRQRDPSTSSILRRRLSDALLQKRMDSQGSLQAQSSVEEPLAKEPKLTESTPVQELSREPPTNAERFMLSKSTFQTKPSIEFSDLYRETMTFGESERQEQPKPKTFDVGIIDLMTLGTSFIRKGDNKKARKSQKDEEIEDGTYTATDDVEDEHQELVTSTTNTQTEFSPPTRSALVHIGQSIHIEEPEDSTKESAMPVKIERRSRRDYPEKMNKKTDDSQEASGAMIQELKKTNLPDEDNGTVENISTTLLPRDLREQSTFSVNSQKIEREKSIALTQSTPSESIKQRDVSTSSLLQKRYNQSCSLDSAQSIDQQAEPTFIKQRDPSKSSLLRNRYSQIMDDHAATENLDSSEVPKTEEMPSKSIELIDRAVSFEMDADVVDSHTENANEGMTKMKLTSSSNAEFRDKMDWINRTYNTR